MANYLGVKCPVCSKRYGQSDDIVVCPICGAPHHRECYAQSGECAFTQDHISGKEWRPPAEEAPPNGQSGESFESAKNCHRCGSANPSETLFCQICGSSLAACNSPHSQGSGISGTGGWSDAGRDGAPNNRAYTCNPPYRPVQNYSDPYASLNNNEKVGEISAKDIAIFVGPSHNYYLERFYQIEKYGRILQPNLAAAVLGFFYYFYRKMYKMGALMLAIFLICMVPFFMFSWVVMPEVLDMFYQTGRIPDPPQMARAIDTARVNLYTSIFSMTAFFNFSLNIIVSLYANKIYHRLVVTKIRETMHEHRHTNEYQVFLPQVGGVNRLAVVLLGVLLFVGSNVIVAAMVFISNIS